METLKTAIIALNAKKARTALTMLGVIIGVFSVVSLMALGRGVENYITDQFDELGSNLLFISPGTLEFSDDPAKSLSRNKLAEIHTKLIETHAKEYVLATSPYIIVGETVSYKTKSYYAEITGFGYNGLDIVNYDVKQGRNFTRAEQKTRKRVAIIGPLIQKELFNGQTSIGQDIRFGGESFEVIGVFAEKGNNYDDQIIVPFTTVMNTFDIKNYSSIVMKIADSNKIDLATRQVELALLRDLDEDDFSIISQQEILGSIQEILQALTIALGAIAGISLLVGGIGIMNIMLVSVTERIREIGLRKAIGATSLNIGVQFMIESILISLGGGVTGVLFGLFASTIANRYDVRTEITPTAVLLAFGFSVFVGVVFGTYPAWQASKKNPIEALRYE